MADCIIGYDLKCQNPHCATPNELWTKLNPEGWCFNCMMNPPKPRVEKRIPATEQMPKWATDKQVKEDE